MISLKSVLAWQWQINLLIGSCIAKRVYLLLLGHTGCPQGKVLGVSFVRKERFQESTAQRVLRRHASGRYVIECVSLLRCLCAL